MTDLWVEASTPYEAEMWAGRMAHAKVAVASLWPFLASAHTPGDFEHRMNLSLEHVASRVDSDLVDSCVNSLYEDWRALHTAAHAQDVVLDSTSMPHIAVRTSSSTPLVSNNGGNAAPLQVFHVASQRWVTVQGAAGQSPENPYYPSTMPEAGPATGETNTFPQHPTGADRGDPINGPDPTDAIPPAESFPAQPQAWTGGPTWQDNPMNFTPPRHSSRRQADVNPNPVQPMLQGGSHYTDEGVESGPSGGQNPYMFDQGSNGLTGQGFPQDVSLPEPDERVDMYQGAQPQAQEMGYSQGYLAALIAAINAEAEYHYVKPAEGGGYNVVQKGTGKVLSHHDSEDEAEASFRAMMQSKHSKRLARQYRVADTGQDNGDMMADNPYATAGDQPSLDNTPTPPPATQQGGPGAEAMPAGAGTGEDTSSTSTSDQAAKMGSHVALRRTADEYRGRPTQYAPEGVPDEYDARTWDSAVKQSPRQSIDDRNVNTPQRADEPIPMVSSSDRQMEPAQTDEEMDRRASIVSVYNGFGQFGQAPLTWGSRQGSPRAAAPKNRVSMIINSSVQRALAQASGRA